MTHGTARMRSAAHLHHVRVAEDDLHALERDVEKVGHDLRKTRLVALAAWLGADDDVHAALRAHGDPRLLVGGADRGLDVIGKAAAEQLAALCGLAPALLEALPVGDLHRPFHSFPVASAVVSHAAPTA